MERDAEGREFLVCEDELAEVIRQETEIEAIGDVDDTEGESHFEYIPSEMPVYPPDEPDFFGDEVKTQEECREASEHECQENEHDSVCMLEEFRRCLDIFDYAVERHVGEELPDDESDGCPSHQVVRLEHAIAYRCQEIQKQHAEKEGGTDYEQEVLTGDEKSHDAESEKVKCGDNPQI